MQRIVGRLLQAMQGYFECLRHPDQARDRGSPHFLHDLGPVNLQSELTDAKLPGGLFVAQTADHEVHDLAFAGRQAGIAPA